jgi:hypothetical protein
VEKFKMRVYKIELVSETNIYAKDEDAAKAKILEGFEESKNVEYIVCSSGHEKPSLNKRGDRENWTPTEFLFDNGRQEE